MFSYFSSHSLVFRKSLFKNGFAVITPGLTEAVHVCDAVAPEHLEVHTNTIAHTKVHPQSKSTKQIHKAHPQSKHTSSSVTSSSHPIHSYQLHCRAPSSFVRNLSHFGCVFIGGLSAEVFGDYGAGPNHTLPTGGSARVFGGLSVLSFLRCRTWLRVDSAAAAREMMDVS